MSAANGSKQIIAGNWKMNLGIEASRALASSLIKHASRLHKSEVWVAPSSIALSTVSETLTGTSIRCGAQNVVHEKSGAFTGELSVSMLKEAGCTFAIVGHSERRHVFAESNDLCVARAAGAIKQDFTVIYCVGETLKEREQSLTRSVVEQQLNPLLSQLNERELAHLIIAYEPVWAIGTGKVATTEQIAEVHSDIATLIQKKFSASTIVPILYGGSVTADNFASIIKLDHVSGALVGGASLSAEKFAPLIQISENN